jgi:hypothetical protein
MMLHTIGDTPILTGNLAADIDGAALVVNVRRPDGTVFASDSAEVVDGNAGAWSAEFDAADLDMMEGWHDLEVRVTYSDTTVQTFAVDADESQLGFENRLPIIA